MTLLKRSLLLLLLFPSIVFADMGSFFNQYLTDLEKNKDSVFYTQCKSKKDAGYEAYLIFVVGEKGGLLVEKDMNAIVNLAKIRMLDNDLQIEDSHGGVYTYNRVKKLAEELLNKPFKLIHPFQYEKLVAQNPEGFCLNVK